MGKRWHFPSNKEKLRVSRAGQLKGSRRQRGRRAVPEIGGKRATLKGWAGGKPQRSRREDAEKEALEKSG